MISTIFFHKTNVVAGCLAGIWMVLAGGTGAQELAQASSPKCREVFIGVSRMSGKLGIEIYVNFVPMGFPPALMQIKPGDLITFLNRYHHEERFMIGRQFHYFYRGEEFLWIDLAGREYMVNDVLRGLTGDLREDNIDFSHLQYLEWYGKLTAGDAKVLAQRCPDLTIYYFSDSHAVPSKILKRLPNITVFDLGDHSEDSCQKKLHQLKRLPNVQILNLGRAEVDEKWLKILKDFPNLRALNLSETNVTDAELRHLQDIQSLEVLSLENTEITDQGLEYIGKLQNLRTLNLDTRGIRGPGLVHLKNLKHLPPG